MARNNVEPMRHRPLKLYATDVLRDWTNMSVPARPYVMAMRDLDQISDVYGLDSARSVVVYFLANAQTWRGETARRIKSELKNILKLLDTNEVLLAKADKNSRVVYGVE